MTDNNTEPAHPGPSEKPRPTWDGVGTPPTTNEEWRAANPDSNAEVPMMECPHWVPPDYTYYTFTAMREFSAFCSSGGEAGTAPEFCTLSQEQMKTSDSEQVEQIKKSCIHFSKAATNSVGGCGCNRSKRVEQAGKVYQDTLTMIAKCPAVCENIKKLLNSVERVHFWRDGSKFSNQARVFNMSNSPRFDWRDSPPPSPFLII